jgi:hypothetical protein
MGRRKKKILGCIFSEKFILQNKKDAAIKYTTPIQVLLIVKEVLERFSKSFKSFALPLIFLFLLRSFI